MNLFRSPWINLTWRMIIWMCFVVFTDNDYWIFEFRQIVFFSPAFSLSSCCCFPLIFSVSFVVCHYSRLLLWFTYDCVTMSVYKYTYIFIYSFLLYFFFGWFYLSFFSLRSRLVLKRYHSVTWIINCLWLCRMWEERIERKKNILSTVLVR